MIVNHQKIPVNYWEKNITYIISFDGVTIEGKTKVLTKCKAVPRYFQLILK